MDYNTSFQLDEIWKVKEELREMLGRVKDSVKRYYRGEIDMRGDQQRIQDSLERRKKTLRMLQTLASLDLYPNEFNSDILALKERRDTLLQVTIGAPLVHPFSSSSMSFRSVRRTPK